jgi:hypothetical protein
MLNLARGLLISLALVGVLYWALQGSPSFESCIQQNHEQTTDNQSEKYDSAFAAAFIARANVYRDCLGNFIHGQKEEILAAFTVILAFSTIFLWVATRDLVKGAEKTARSELRAYVGVVNVTLTGVVATDSPLVAIRFKNFGKTPAYEVATWMDCVLEIADAPEKSLKFGKEWSGSSIINPDDSFTTRSTREVISEEDAKAVIDDVKRLYFRGGVRYRDAFGKKRETIFGFETRGNLIATKHMMVSVGRNNAT